MLKPNNCSGDREKSIIKQVPAKIIDIFYLTFSLIIFQENSAIKSSQYKIDRYPNNWFWKDGGNKKSKFQLLINV